MAEGVRVSDAGTFLAREKLKYQRVGVGDGATTPGHDRSYLNDVIFGPDFSGQSLLDIGSFLGYFCLEALERGAGSATGIEPDDESVRQAREIASLRGHAPEYINDDFERFDWSGRAFDVVICLNVLHHMFDSVHSLRQMMKLARRKVVLEFAAPRLSDVGLGMFNPLALLSAAAPAIVLGAPRKSVDVASRTFLFSRQAMQALFNKHTSVFEPVSIARSPFKGRLILSAVKRRIGHLVVVAGPTSAGKSTLIERLRSDPAVRARIGLDEGGWLFDNAHLAALPNGPIERLVLHYDILRPWGRSIRSYGRDPALDLLDVAERVTVLTLMASPATMLKQIEQGELGRSGWKKPKRHHKLHERYRDAGFLEDWYRRWAAFIGAEGPKRRHAIVVNGSDGDLALHDAAGWSALYRSFADAG